MGHKNQNSNMALSTFFHDSSLFPRMVSRHPFFSPRSHSFPRPFDLFNESSHLFEDMQERQEAFLRDMGDGSTAESAAQQGRGPPGTCWVGPRGKSVTGWWRRPGRATKPLAR